MNRKLPVGAKFIFVEGVYSYRDCKVTITHTGTHGGRESTWEWRAECPGPKLLKGKVWGGLRSAQLGAGNAIDYWVENGEEPPNL